jgi:translation initiation factor 2-alpha kinase 4
MAWNGAGARKTPIVTSPNKNQNDTSFPGLRPHGQDTGARIEYEELQQNEVMALEAIYADDFVNHTSEQQSAWKVRHGTLCRVWSFADGSTEN